MVIVNTSPLLYLHQVKALNLLLEMYAAIIVATAVPQELAIGAVQRISVPDYTNALPLVFLGISITLEITL
jgi:predicted nucleic acid-binding protein